METAGAWRTVALGFSGPAEGLLELRDAPHVLRNGQIVAVVARAALRHVRRLQIGATFAFGVIGRFEYDNLVITICTNCTVKSSVF